MAKKKVRKNNEYILKNMVVDEFIRRTAYDSIILCDNCIHQRKGFHPDNRYKDGGYYVYSCGLNSDRFVNYVVDGRPGEFCCYGESKQN